MTTSPADCEKWCGATATRVSTEPTKPSNGVATTELAWRDVTASPPRSRSPGPSPATVSQSSVAGRRDVENQTSRPGPVKSVLSTTAAGAGPGTTPAGEGVSS